jgi:hypothetical protein
MMHVMSWGVRSLGALAVLALVACSSSSPVSRIDTNRVAYESWPLEVQEAVLSGIVKKGMTPDQVEMALGRPTQVISRSANGDDEIWIYRRGGSSGSSILNNSNVTLGVPIGGVNVITSPRNRGMTPEEEEVVFVNGVVVGTEVK